MSQHTDFMGAESMPAGTYAGMHVYDAYYAGIANADELFDPMFEDEYAYEGPILTEWDVQFDKKVKQMCKDGGPITRQREEELAELIKGGSKEAEHELVIAHMPFAAWYVRESMGFHKKHNQQHGSRPRTFKHGGGLIQGLAGAPLDYADRLQVAHEVMLVTAERYTDAKIKFITRAGWNIEKILKRTVDDTSTMHKVPTSMQKQIKSLGACLYRLAKTEDLPTDIELILGSDMSSGLDKVINTDARMQHISYEVIQAFFVDKETAASESILDRVDPNEAMDAMQPEDYCNDDDEYDYQTSLCTDEAIKDALLRLKDKRDLGILITRFGLNGDDPKTLDQVGQEFGLNRERVRQIEARTLASLRHPYPSSKLYELAKLGNKDDDMCTFTGLRSGIPITEEELQSLGVKPVIRYKKDKTKRTRRSNLPVKKYEDEF